MSYSERNITRVIVREAAKDWEEISDTDIVIVGAGPAGLTAAYYLREFGFDVVVFERRLSFGGGIGGGGMLFHKIVIEEEAKEIAEGFGMKLKEVESGLYSVDSSDFLAKLSYSAVESGAKVILGVTVDDVVFRPDPLRISGVLVQWSAVQISGLHVDPLMIESKAVVDATGHDAEIISIAARKLPELEIFIHGEKSAYSEMSEKLVVEKTGKVAEGLYAAGMAVAAVHGLPRMGPIFGGMLMSGRKVAEQIMFDLKK
ncbi:sulfide-dependent adenosine diphosphate thiazole synthase [Geoglobus acetivorans]|uniref:Thiamine thiazole synthase n=1 Tax=Geoglobus acetivorans TaxID=565033 RepID=A0ABZ3H2I9_GEOAI|nr:thiazole biosynthesis protein [Geoglobus acetivorans]